MVSAAGELPVGRLRPQSLGDRLRALLLRSEPLRGYLLLSPTLLVMFLMLVVPLGGMIAFSFFTQVYFDIDPTPTLNNYWTIVKPGAGQQLSRHPLPVRNADLRDPAASNRCSSRSSRRP